MKRIFISYSHKDKEWKDRLVTQLKELEMQGVCRIWDDSQIPPGEDWKKEIEMAMDTADGAVLMISEDFLASDFIIKHEVPLILSKKGDNFNVFPIIVKSCHWQKFKWLSDIQVFPPDGVPLIESSESEIKDNLTNLAKIIKDIIKQPSASIPGAEKAVLLTDLPQREIDLIGRAEELQMLEKRLKETNRLLLLNGLGGIGKTEVCKRFFLDHYKEFAFAGWIDYVSSVKESIVAGIKTNKVELNVGDTLDERFERILEFLKTLDEDSLLVIDNIEDPEDEHLGTIKTLPFKVIANSRLKLEGFEVHTLDFLSPQSCKDLFYTYYEGETDDEYVEKIIDLCGQHTLTVELLARTAQNAAMPVKSLYETLQNKGFNLNDVIGENVHTFWHNEKQRKRFFDHLLTLFNLSKVTNAELDILVNLAVLPAIDIPVKDFSEWLGLKSKEDINSLVRKGWLRKSGFTVFMHQVIQEVIRYKTHPDIKTCGNLIQALADNLSVEPGENPLDKKKYVIFADSLLQHIHDSHEDAATLANNLSLRYKELGQLEPALEFQNKALEIRESVLDKNHPDLATSYNNLSTIYKALGQLEPALEFQKKTVEIFEKKLDKNHPLLATSYNNLSMIYQDLGQLEPALEFQKKTLKIKEAVLDKNHPSLATSYNNLSSIYKALGQLEPALEFQKKTLEIL
nr:tetratricopeptide repeat protein [Candidatus Aminicenantes bacterium]NIQ70892.1 tetratricopeptide repeat protein [Candidatus Aminicenantes bacterium]NIT26941.1 tetratricopeptide repeat protein [Candidatus Aminicenantes bacterium]